MKILIQIGCYLTLLIKYNGREVKRFALSNLSIYFTWENIKKFYKNNKSKISAPTRNDTFGLPDKSYSASDIQDYFDIQGIQAYYKKNHEIFVNNPPIKLYTNKI